MCVRRTEMTAKKATKNKKKTNKRNKKHGFHFQRPTFYLLKNEMFNCIKTTKQI